MLLTIHNALPIKRSPNYQLHLQYSTIASTLKLPIKRSPNYQLHLKHKPRVTHTNIFQSSDRLTTSCILSRRQHWDRRSHFQSSDRLTTSCISVSSWPIHCLLHLPIKRSANYQLHLAALDASTLNSAHFQSSDRLTTSCIPQVSPLFLCLDWTSNQAIG